MIPYTKEAYKAKKYAFVSDYARFWILYHYGGIYFDTDVEVIKNMDDIIARGPFMGCENEAKDTSATNVVPGLGLGVNPGLGLGVNPGHLFYKKMLDLYSSLYFIKENGMINYKTIVEYTTESLVNNGLRNINSIQNIANIWIYPKEYFCPINYETKLCTITDKTRTIHHFSESWKSLPMLIKQRFIELIGKRNALILSNIKQKVRKFKI